MFKNYAIKLYYFFLFRWHLLSKWNIYLFLYFCFGLWFDFLSWYYCDSHFRPVNISLVSQFLYHYFNFPIVIIVSYKYNLKYNLNSVCLLIVQVNSPILLGTSHISTYSPSCFKFCICHAFLVFFSSPFLHIFELSMSFSFFSP